MMQYDNHVFGKFVLKAQAEYFDHSCFGDFKHQMLIWEKKLKYTLHKGNDFQNKSHAVLNK